MKSVKVAFVEACTVALLGVVGAVGCGGSSQQNQRGTMPADPLEGVSAQKLAAQGAELARRGQLVSAEQYLVAAIERGYPTRRALPLLLDICLRASRLRAALSYAEPYLRTHPSDWSLRLVVASVYLGLGETEKAVEELRRVVEDAPQDATGHYMLAVVLRDEAQDFSAAEDHFKFYLTLAPQGEHFAEARASVERMKNAPLVRSDDRAGRTRRPRHRRLPYAMPKTNGAVGETL